MMGAVVKVYRILRPQRFICCIRHAVYGQKYEIQRPEMEVDGQRDVDAIP